jgi:RHS repeat-associated protein
MSDALGSTIGLYSGGAVSHTYTYEPYGASTQAGSGDHPYRFTGREWDGATNLQFNRARYYNPTWGRFLSEDPTLVGAGGNGLFGYAWAAPTEFTDPLGWEAQSNVYFTLADFCTDINPYCHVPPSQLWEWAWGSVQDAVGRSLSFLTSTGRTLWGWAKVIGPPTFEWGRSVICVRIGWGC